jgi:hypothetical protein
LRGDFLKRVHRCLEIGEKSQKEREGGREGKSEREI